MIKVTTGCMKSGKTQALIKDIQIAQLMHKKVGIFYSLSCEENKNTIQSRNSLSSTATPISGTDFLKNKEDFIENYDYIFIDDAQFLAGVDLKKNHPEYTSRVHKIYDIQKSIQDISDHGVHIYFYGIDTNFAANTFDIMDRMLGIADEVIKETAICEKCRKKNARRNLRLLNGKPDDKDSDILVVKGTENYDYIPVCVDCYTKAYKENK